MHLVASNRKMAEWFDEYPDEGEDLYDQMYKNLEAGLNANGTEKDTDE